MKKYFFTGLLMLLPFALTLFLTGVVIDFLAKPFQNIMASILSYYGLFSKPLFVFNGDQVLHQSSKLLALVNLFFLVLLIGFLGRLVFVNTFLHFADLFIHRIPFVNKIYKAFKEMVHTIFNSSDSTFSQVVLAPFPYGQIFSIGLIPNTPSTSETDDEGDLVSVFIPGTPNPTGGFLLKFKRKELIFTDMKVEDALKFVVSCGVLPVDFSKSSEAKGKPHASDVP